jgi:hypothetical protein
MTLYGTFPLLVPGSTESTSVYGLKKTSGTILFKAGEEASALSLAEQSGSVFPDPQIRTTDIGLLEMSFDAYTETADTDTGVTSGVFGTEVLNLSKSFESTITQAVGNNPPAPITYNWTITEIWIADSFTGRKVVEARFGSVSFTVSEKLLNKRLLKRIITGKLPTGGAGTRTLSITWTSQVSSVTRRNFGSFDEVDIVSSLKAEIA